MSDMLAIFSFSLAFSWRHTAPEWRNQRNRGAPEHGSGRSRPSLNWYPKAAEQGDAGAQLNLGVMYANGAGVAENDGEAVRWIRQASEHGGALAQPNLVSKYYWRDYWREACSKILYKLILGWILPQAKETRRAAEQRNRQRERINAEQSAESGRYRDRGRRRLRSWP